MRIRKQTPTILVPARSLRVGSFILANSGDIREVTPEIKRALPKQAHVRTFAA